MIIFIKFSEADPEKTHALEGSTEQSTEMKSYTNQIVPESQPECDAAKFTTSNERSLKKKLRPKLYQVNFSKCSKRGDGISMLTAFHYYHTAPVVKFCYHTVGTSAWPTLPSYVIVCVVCTQLLQIQVMILTMGLNNSDKPMPVFGRKWHLINHGSQINLISKYHYVH